MVASTVLLAHHLALIAGWHVPPKPLHFHAPDSMAARISLHAWCWQLVQSRLDARQWSYACTSSWVSAWLISSCCWKREAVVVGWVVYEHR